MNHNTLPTVSPEQNDKPRLLARIRARLGKGAAQETITLQNVGEKSAEVNPFGPPKPKQGGNYAMEMSMNPHAFSTDYSPTDKVIIDSNGGISRVKGEAPSDAAFIERKSQEEIKRDVYAKATYVSVPKSGNENPFKH